MLLRYLELYVAILPSWLEILHNDRWSLHGLVDHLLRFALDEGLPRPAS